MVQIGLVDADKCTNADESIQAYGVSLAWGKWHASC